MLNISSFEWNFAVAIRSNIASPYGSLVIRNGAVSNFAVIVVTIFESFSRDLTIIHDVGSSWILYGLVGNSTATTARHSSFAFH